MASRIEIRPQARQDIIEIATHIGFDNAVAADRFLDATEETFSFLSDFPQAGGKCLIKLKQLSGLRVFRIRGFPMLFGERRSCRDHKSVPWCSRSERSDAR